MPSDPTRSRPGRSSPADPTRSRPDRSATDVVGARIAAQIVDVILMTVQLIAVGLLIAMALGIGPRASVLLGLFTLPLYGGLLEGYWDGQTIGKRLAGIRVVGEYGSECAPSQAVIRNLPAALVPGWLVYLVALASMAASDHRQRVFDRIAGTVVVRA